ncbi:ATPase, T2SS/T4P/T4SS family [Nocardia sp. IFM 10818]
MTTNPTPRRGFAALRNGHHVPSQTPAPHRDLTSLFPTIPVEAPTGAWYVPPAAPPPPMPTPAPTPQPAVADLELGDGVDPRIAVWREDRALVERLTSEAARRLADRTRERDAAVADPEKPHVALAYTEDEREAVGTQIVRELVRQHIDDLIDTGGPTPTPTPAREQAIVAAVADTMFRLGPLQPIVDEPDVENILWTNNATTVMYGDGRSEQRPPVFENEQAAIKWIVLLANKAPGGGRAFSPANPALRLNMPGNIRLSALGWAVTGGVSIAVRKHLHKDITMARLVDMGVMPPQLARMLTCATRDGCSVVISGPMGVGKTTLLRALAAELPLETRIGTAEMIRELYLHELPGREPYVVSAEVITGGGERNEFTDALKGKFGLHDILAEFVSQQLERVIVGEVAGREILALFKAMQMAQGSLSTVHSYTCAGAIDRLVTLALEEPGVHETYANRQVAAHIQLIVQMHTHKYRDADNVLRAHRHVSEVAWLEPGEDSRPATTTLYRRPTPDAHPRWGSLPPMLRERVVAQGFLAEDWSTYSLDLPDKEA